MLSASSIVTLVGLNLSGRLLLERVPVRLKLASMKKELGILGMG